MNEFRGTESWPWSWICKEDVALLAALDWCQKKICKYLFCISKTSDSLYFSDDENIDNAEEWTEKSGK